MDIFNIIMMCGGLAFFLYGMSVLSGGLEKLAGGKMQSILQKITGSKVKGLAVGTVVTAVIQSSSATTVMLVGLVNAGLMTLSQSIGVVMGSNIGTTMTAWILSLTGIESGNVFIQLLKPANFSPIIALIGAMVLLMSKNEKHKNVATIGMGFAVLMYGMTMMSDAVEPLADMPQFTNLLIAFSNPILGVLVGTVFTAIIQSSSASVGVLQALSMTGAVTYSTAVPLILGQNIGTCISALMALPGTNKNAKRVAIVHVLIKVIGMVVWLVLWSLANIFFDFAFMDATASPVGIAVIHTIFNILNTFTLLPFTNLLEKMSKWIIRGEDAAKEEIAGAALDERLLQMPALAVSRAYDATKHMAHIANQTVNAALALFDNYDLPAADEIARKEKTLDKYEDEVGTYLVSVSRCDLSEADARVTAMLLHTISDFERIGDHATNMVHTAAEMANKGITYSAEAKTELRVLTDAVQAILANTATAFAQNDLTAAADIEPLEQVIDDLINTIRTRHITRLQSGNCTIELGFILTDFLTDCERISDHCSNIGVALLETAHGTFDTHARLGKIKSRPNEDFRQSYERYSRTYALHGE